SVFAVHRTQWFAAEKRKNGGKRFALALPKLFPFDDLHLLARKEFKEALELASIKSTIDISETACFGRRRAYDTRLFFAHRIEEIEWLAAFEPLHIPMGKRAVHRISQKDKQFNLWVVFPDPFRHWLVIDVTWRAITGEARGSKQRIVLVQLLVIGPGNKHCVIIEKMYFLLVAHVDVGMLV